MFSAVRIDRDLHYRHLKLGKNVNFSYCASQIFLPKRLIPPLPLLVPNNYIISGAPAVVSNYIGVRAHVNYILTANKKINAQSESCNISLYIS